MQQNKKISTYKFHHVLPAIERNACVAEICKHCSYINEIEYAYCTNCGYPLHNELLVDAYNKKLKERNELLFKAQSAVLVARIMLYIMGSFILLGVLFVFSESNSKYVIAMLALTTSGLFFFLALWSRSNPFSAMLTAFIILITFSAINIFNKLVQSFTTSQGLIGMLLCLSLLFIVFKGVQGAYYVTLMKQELQNKL